MNKLKTISGALALTLMLFCGVVSVAQATNRSMANPIRNSAGIATMGKDQQAFHHHRHHRRHRHMHRWHR
ncbi:MAG TPA: hypothetical protein VGN86_16345 [Pyrinomonadaceae bacterium]|nr:hypothetical protein [Pyrinomonadaceae bacterium]